MLRRKFNTLLLASAATFALAGAAHAEDGVIKIGVSAPKSGVQTAGAEAVFWPTVKLWKHDIDEAGGIEVDGKKLKVELVEYDDQSDPQVAIKNIQRLATVDEVDFVVSPYTTGINLATAPVIAKYKYPQIVATGNANNLDQFVQRWPNTFWMLGTSARLATGIVDTLTKMREKGEIGDRVAVVYVSDAFGQEMSSAGLPALQEAGFKIVFKASYPLGTQDVSPIISSAKASRPDAFVAYSYPPDSFGLTGQAMVQGFNPKVFYVGVGGALAGYGFNFGANVEGIMTMGGIDPNDPQFKDFQTRLKSVTDVDSDYWANPVVYASLEVLAQGITQAGTLDRDAVNKTIQEGTFNTVMGEIKFNDNILEKQWTVGQWHDGVLHGVNGHDVGNTGEAFVKPEWKK